MTKQQVESMVCTILSNEPFDANLAAMTDSQIGFYLEGMGYEASKANIRKMRKALGG